MPGPALRPLALAALALAGCARDIPLPTVPASADAARGRYLAAAGMGCVVCHSPRDWTHFGGPVVEGAEFTGAPGFSKEQGFPDSFQFGAAALTPVDASGFQTPMPWWAYAELTEEDLGALFDDLRALPPVENAVVRHTP